MGTGFRGKLNFTGAKLDGANFRGMYGVEGVSEEGNSYVRPELIFPKEYGHLLTKEQKELVIRWV
ncbi:Uncharacterised protein [Candidatus Burarchaeum australiense]|nr:Uncharacterised protein [Candidatus Burarchaeum australiense]